MATKPPAPDEPNTLQAREISPFFSLPNEDGTNANPRYDSDQSQQQYPPITLSCAHCERIVGDSSAFLFATRQMATITLDRMVSVTVGLGGLKTSLEGKWDEFCNYKSITCGKCTTALGKMYFATTSKLSALQNKYTLRLTALSFYHHASSSPSLPIAATSEIYAQLHPSPEALAENIDHIMTICVMLREEQGDIIRELKKLGAATGVDVDLEDGGTSGDSLDAKESWREKVQALDELLRKVKSLEEAIEGLRMRLGDEGKGGDPEVTMQRELKEGGAVLEEPKDKERPKASKEPRRKKLPDIVASDLVPQPPLALRQQEKKVQRATLPPQSSALNKRKRKSTSENTAAAAGKQIYVDLSNTPDEDFERLTPPPPPLLQLRRKSKKEVPNSQSAGEEEAPLELTGLAYKSINNNEEHEEVEEVVVEEDEVEEDQIKSPAEKRRKGVAVSIVSKKEVVGRRASQGKKVYK